MNPTRDPDNDDNDATAMSILMRKIMIKSNLYARNIAGIPRIAFIRKPLNFLI